jgi:integrase
MVLQGVGFVVRDAQTGEDPTGRFWRLCNGATSRTLRGRVGLDWRHVEHSWRHLGRGARLKRSLLCRRRYRRHTTAVHLLRAGVDINTIRAWLGHGSLDTTHIYAEVDMEMKAKALASVDISGLKGRLSNARCRH